MKKKLIALLQKQIDKLDQEDFDLEAWKSATSSVLARVFGEKDHRIASINDLRIDYSSWALRDSNSSYQPLVTNKKKGKAILETAIEELEIFGTPTKLADQLENFFAEEDIKILLSESKASQKKKLLDKLKKEDLKNLLLKLVSTS